MSFPTYAALYRELLTVMYDVRWEGEDATLPIGIMARMWQPTLERDVMLINRWVTLLTYCIYTRPGFFDEQLQALGRQVRETLANAGCYDDENPEYLRISHPRIQAERYFFLLTRGWADELRISSKAHQQQASTDASFNQLLQARVRLGQRLMNFSSTAILTEAILDAPLAREGDPQVELWLNNPDHLQELHQHMRTLRLLHAQLQTLPVFKELTRAHFELFYNAAEKNATPPFYTADSMPQVAY